MFLAQIHKTDEPPADPPCLVAALGHLRQDAEWETLDRPGCRLVWCRGPGMSPVVAHDPGGDWLLAYGTPTRAGSGICALSERIAEWLADVARRDLTVLRDCDGLYAFVSYHAQRRELSVLTDRSGMIPVYVSEDGDTTWVASSATAIGCLRPVTVSLDALSCLMVIGYCIRDMSLFAEVKRVGPGMHVCCDGRKTTRTKWWTPPAKLTKPANIRELAQEYVQERETSLRQRLSDAPKIVSTLTGGLDSRCMCALLSKVERPISYMTGHCDGIGVAGDIARAGRVAEKLGLPWTLQPPLAYSVETWRSLVLRNALISDGELQPVSTMSGWARSFGGRDTVILWGLGGEVFRDYWSGHEKVAFLLKGATRIERLINYRCGGGHAALRPALAQDYRAVLRERAVAALEQSDRELEAADPLQRLDMLYILERIRRWASIHLLTTGWWSIPEVPLLGQRSFDLGYSLPTALRKGGELARWAIWLAWPDAARLSHNRGYPTQPAALTGIGGRLRVMLLGGEKLARKLIRRHVLRRSFDSAEAFTGQNPTYGETFEDLLDPEKMRSAFLYEPQALRALIDGRRRERLKGSSPLNLALELEAVLRAATRLQPGRVC